MFAALPDYVQRLRVDLRYARIYTETLKRAHLSQKKKSEELERENNRLKKENEKLKQEKETLKAEIDKLTASNAALAKTNNRYQVSLFDHGNFTHPNKLGGKKKGGQIGHTNTNNDGQRNYASFERQRIFAQVCGGCGKHLTRAGSIKEKTLIDIELNPKLIQLIVQSERQWCGNCQKEVRATYPHSLPFTEYGINTFMVVMYLRFKGKQSMQTIATTLNNLFGLGVTKSGVGSLLRQAKKYLAGKYQQLKQAIRDGDVMYNDETGWTVRGKIAWMWIMATPDKKLPNGDIQAGMTVYVAAESKGKGIFEAMYGNSQARSMHDGNSSYVAVTGEEKSAYCWAHVLRFCYEETVKLDVSHLACKIRDRLVDLYQTIRSHPDWTTEQKEVVLRSELDNILLVDSTDKTVSNILHRIKTQKAGLILALLITEDGTNNLAEREFRELAISRNISFGSDTYTGMEVTAILASVVKTIGRDKSRPFLPILKSYLQEGIKQKYSQYKHSPFFDT